MLPQALHSRFLMMLTLCGVCLSFSATTLEAQEEVGASDVSPTKIDSFDESGVNSGDDNEAGDDELDALLDLEIDELGTVDAIAPTFDVEVVSVTKTRSTIGKSPAAVYVVTQEMIRRSGVTSIPDALRMVPGMQVARNNSSRWAVSTRGFNNVFANKQLVLIDGRSIYTQLFGGVYWEVEDVVLQDIERIEVIRGPGATLWGANAVNGVINIITKKSKDTQGTLVSSGGGDQDRHISQFRHGSELGKDFYFRVYGKHREHNEGFASGGVGGHDDWRIGRVGFRADWEPQSQPDSVTVQGQIYSGQIGVYIANKATPIPPFTQTLIDDAEVNGGHLLARWNHEISDDAHWTLQVYYDRVQRRDITTHFSVDIFDIDFQNQFVIADDHRFTWGGNYRHYGDHVRPVDPFALGVNDSTREIERSGVFLQDEITLAQDWKMIVGSKFSYNDLSRFEYQPGVRLIHTPDENHAFWGSVSRAVRTPSRVSDDIMVRQFAAPPFVFAQIRGNDRLQAEDLMAYEMGMRVKESDHFSWDWAVYYNRFEDLVGLSMGPISGLPPTFPLNFQDGGQGHVYGTELSAQWQVHEDWQLQAWYSLIRMHLDGTGLNASTEGNVPRSTAFLMSSWNLCERWELDLITRYSDHLPSRNVDSYIGLDVRVGFSPIENLNLSVVGQNLLRSHHTQFRETNGLPSPSEVRRGVFSQIDWRF
jgi:iron complex outermembrane recepter protein